MLPANWLTEVINLAAFAALAVTLYVVFWPRIKATWADHDPDLRARDIRARYADAQAKDGGMATRQGLLLRHIRSAIHNERLTCLFVNDGDAALNLRVEVDGVETGSINPSDHLPTGQTGSIRLELPTPELSRDVVFSIRYEDENGHVRREGHVFRCREREFIRQPEAAA